MGRYKQTCTTFCSEHGEKMKVDLYVQYVYIGN